jgi:antitoxin (DNA-binding transcriptional repressor) of toxin-antitoxin stability system
VKGEEVVITRHDKPIARIVPEGQPRLEQVRLAVAGIRGLRAEIQARTGRRQQLSDAEVRMAVEEGRR